MNLPNWQNRPQWSCLWPWLDPAGST